MSKKLTSKKLKVIDLKHLSDKELGALTIDDMNLNKIEREAWLAGWRGPYTLTNCFGALFLNNKVGLKVPKE